MLLLFLLLLPLALLPFLAERGGQWFRRLAWLIAGAQVLLAIGSYIPEATGSFISRMPHLSGGFHWIIRTFIQIYS